ncbi:MAG: fused MFS/spermidine synthase [Bryobacterales bacterium]|nr:fused MFS/spermidine synthase [Bryobacterales bacterium]
MPQPAAPWGRLELIAFVSGAAVMVLEITGSRILAPFLGTSVFVWTTLIGVIMASLSTGYWWGGRMADQQPVFSRLALILALAGACAGFTAVAQQSVLEGLEAAHLELRLAALAATLVLFAPASVLLGMVTPYVARLKLESLSTAGAQVGRLYAISTAGSIAGTFAAGYFLLALLGSSRILYGIAFALVALSFVAASASRVGERGGLLVFLLLAAMLSEHERAALARSGYLDLDTAYQRVFIIDGIEPETGRPVRLLRAEESNTQSAIYLDSADLRSPYLHAFHRVTVNHPSLRRVLMIGAAGYAFPRFQLERFPQTQVDVVEIDPAMTTMAHRYFGLTQNPRLSTFHADGRTFVNRTQSKYDVIYLDAFQTRTPPFQLLTHEFVRNLARRLEPGGMVVLNLIASAEHAHSGLAPAIYSTFHEVFQDTRLLQVNGTLPLADRQNLLLVASTSSLPPVGNTMDPVDDVPLTPVDTSAWKGIILRDDYAPVEVLGEMRTSTH